MPVFSLLANSVRALGPNIYNRRGSGCQHLSVQPSLHHAPQPVGDVVRMQGSFAEPHRAALFGPQVMAALKLLSSRWLGDEYVWA